MKLEMMTGWAAVCLLGVSTLLTPSKVSAGFVTIDEFEEPYDPQHEVGGSRGGVGVSFDGELDDGKGLTASGAGGPFGSALLEYKSISIGTLIGLRLTGVENPDVTDSGSGSPVTVYADLYNSEGAWLDWASDTISSGGSVSYLEFGFAGVDDVKELIFTFESDEEFALTSTNLQADFDSSAAPQATPEPTSLVLFGLASAGGGLAAWRKRRKQGTPSAMPS